MLLHDNTVICKADVLPVLVFSSPVTPVHEYYRPVAVLDRIDVEDTTLVNKLMGDCKTAKNSTRKQSKKPQAMDDETEEDSEVEKEIRRLSKLQVLLNTTGVKSEERRNRIGKCWSAGMCTCCVVYVV